jgi:hypothetical protein
MKWILFSQREPQKIKYSFYEIQVETNTDNFGKLFQTELFFWDEDGWYLCDKYSVIKSIGLSDNYFEINNPIKWREFRAPNLVD